VAGAHTNRVIATSHQRVITPSRKCTIPSPRHRLSRQRSIAASIF